jgi:hypothetical protein
MKKMLQRKILMMIMTLYNVADTGDHGQPENTDTEHSETGRKHRQGDECFSR